MVGDVGDEGVGIPHKGIGFGGVAGGALKGRQLGQDLPQGPAQLQGFGFGARLAQGCAGRVGLSQARLCPAARGSKGLTT